MLDKPLPLSLFPPLQNGDGNHLPVLLGWGDPKAGAIQSMWYKADMKCM